MLLNWFFNTEMLLVWLKHTLSGTSIQQQKGHWQTEYAVKAVMCLFRTQLYGSWNATRWSFNCVYMQVSACMCVPRWVCVLPAFDTHVFRFSSVYVYVYLCVCVFFVQQKIKSALSSFWLLRKKLLLAKFAYCLRCFFRQCLSYGGKDDKKQKWTNILYENHLNFYNFFKYSEGNPVKLSILKCLLEMFQMKSLSSICSFETNIRIQRWCSYWDVREYNNIWISFI